MSYILDALRRADSERAAVPGLHTQAVAPLGDDDDDSDSPSTRPRGARWMWPALAGVILAGGLAWWLMPSSNPPAAELEAGAQAVQAARASAALPYNPPPAVPGTSPAAARPGLPPIAAGGDLPPLPESAAPRAPTSEPAPARAAAPPAPAGMRAGSAPLQLDALPPGGAAAMPTQPPPRARNPEPAASANAPRIYALSELPEEVRRELPSLQVAGSVYSPDPASRMLILNGQLFHEQDDLGNGVKVEQIKARAAVLSFKGYRYQISY